MSEKNLPQSNKHPIPSTMMAVVTTGNGGYDKLEYKRVPLPQLCTGEVLLKVLAAGMNNTEINTRVGWYSKSVISSTEVLSETQTKSLGNKSDGGWNKTTPFPIIEILFFLTIPEGNNLNLYVIPSITNVWPALCPP